MIRVLASKLSKPERAFQCAKGSYSTAELRKARMRYIASKTKFLALISLTQATATECEKTARIYESEHLASWREKTANALQQYVTEFMNRSTKMHGLAVWQVREWSSQQADMTLKKISRGM